MYELYLCMLYNLSGIISLLNFQSYKKKIKKFSGHVNM